MTSERLFNSFIPPRKLLYPPKQISGYAPEAQVSPLELLKYARNQAHHVQCESKNPPPQNFLTFFPNGCEFLVQILLAYYSFLSMLEYKFFNYLQLRGSYAILSVTTIMFSKCPPSTEMHAGWSHLIWHNFVILGDN